MNRGPDFYPDDPHATGGICAINLDEHELTDWASRDLAAASPADRERIIWARVWRNPGTARTIVANAIEDHGGLFDAEIGVRRFGAGGVHVEVPAGAATYLDALRALEDLTLDRAMPDALKALLVACRRLRDEDRIDAIDRGEAVDSVAKAFNEVDR